MSTARKVLVLATTVVTATALATQVAASATPKAAHHGARSLSRAAGPAISAPEQVTAGKARALGATSTSQHLRLVLGLKTPHPGAEDAFVASLQNKSSPNFHHYLTAAQWNARFAPSAASYHAVVKWAQIHGLTVSGRYKNRLIVDVVGTVGTIQHAFGVSIKNYRLGNTRFFSNTQAVKLPPALSSVQSVEGLNSLQQLKPTSPKFVQPYKNYVAGPVKALGASLHGNGSKKLFHKAMAKSKAKQAKVKANAAGVGPKITNGYYDPTDIYSDAAYSVNALYAQGHCCNPTGNPNQTPPATSIAISSVGNQNGNDIAGFHTQYPYLAYDIQQINIDGTGPANDEEGTLDAEWSTAMSNSFGGFQSTSKVYMYDGVNAGLGTFTDIWNRMLSDNVARVMSSSWGCAESYCYDSGTMNTDHGIFDSMVGQGWTLMSASDDKGAYADCSHVSVEYPASDPDLLSAGGTNLYLSGSGGPFSNETAWVGGTGAGSCANNGGGGGGGCSVQWSLPSYQNGRIQSLCSTRAEPDFSLNAGIGENFYYNGALRGVGGTSIVSPELAGIWAQINAYLDSLPSAACSGGCSTVGQANPDVYNSISGGRHDPFYDITSGCTTNDAGGGYCGITGYDRATGLGSANLFQLANQVLWFNVIELSGPTISFSGPATNTYLNGGTISWNITDNPTDGTATGVQGYTAQWDSDPGDPTTEPHGGSGNYFWDGPAVKNATSGSDSISTPGEGCHTLYVRAWDNIGDSSLNTYGPVCYDGTAPVLGVQTSKFIASKQVPTDGTVPVQVRWTGSDALSGLNEFLVWESVDGGSYTEIATPGGTTKVLGVNLAPGHKYQFAIGAYDNAGNFGGYVFERAFKLSLFQEKSTTVSYAGNWINNTTSTALGGALDYTKALNATATFGYTGRSVAWIGGVGSAYGTAAVTVNGGSPTTVDANQSTTKPRVMLYVNNDTVSNSHTLVVSNNATSGHPRIDVDAFAVMANS